MEMRTNLKMINDSGVLRFKGMYSYFSINTERIEVDGKFYERTEREEVCKTTDEIRKETEPYWFRNHEYNFNEIDEKVIIEDCSRFTRCWAQCYNMHFSENDYIQRILIAFHEGLLSKKIKSLYTDKTNKSSRYWRYNPSDADYSTLEKLEVVFLMCSYGYNNSLYYTVSLKDFFEIPVDKLPEDIVRYFNRQLNINLNNNNNYDNALKLLTKKISYETSKQQKYGRISF